jgi:HPt (histidine-containing phosphotransfer) domain-containing protein
MIGGAVNVADCMVKHGAKRVKVEATRVPAIDMRVISQLAEDDKLGQQFIEEIIDVFLGDLSERVRAIGSQVRSNDSAGIKMTAHAIRGSCSHFGAVRLMELSGEIEEKVKSGQTAGLQTAIDSMVLETRRVRAAVKAFRAGMRSSDQ